MQGYSGISFNMSGPECGMWRTSDIKGFLDRQQVQVCLIKIMVKMTSETAKQYTFLPEHQM